MWEKAVAAWDGLDARTGTNNFNASEWLIGISEIFGPEMLQRLVEKAVQHGHYLSVPQAMRQFLEAKGNEVEKFHVGLETPLPLGDLGRILSFTPNLKELGVTCWHCGPKQGAMPMSVLDKDGLFPALGQLGK